MEETNPRAMLSKRVTNSYTYAAEVTDWNNEKSTLISDHEESAVLEEESHSAANESNSKKGKGDLATPVQQYNVNFIREIVQVLLVWIILMIFCIVFPSLMGKNPLFSLSWFQWSTQSETEIPSPPEVSNNTQ